MNIVLNSKYQAASTKIFIDDLGPKLGRHHTVAYDDWENYEQYDLALFMRPRHIADARAQNPEIGIGIMDAKIRPDRPDIYQGADFLVVGSVEQKNKMLRYCDDVLIYRDFPEYEYGEPRTHRERDSLRLGYHGNWLHLQHFDPVLTGALEKLGSNYDIELHVIYNHEKHGLWKHGIPDSIPVKHIQWSPDAYSKYLSKVDIGLKNDCIPEKNTVVTGLKGKNLLDSVWNINETYLQSSLLERALKKQDIFPVSQRRRHDYRTRYKYTTNPGRLYPFARLGVPVVADFTPSNAEMITHGKSGYLASTQESWVTYISQLIEDPEKRELQAQRLLNTICEDHSLEASYERLNSFITHNFG